MFCDVAALVGGLVDESALFIAGSECAELSLVQSRVWMGMALDRCVGAIDVASEAEQGEQQDGVDEGLR